MGKIVEEGIKLTDEEMRLIVLFEGLTRAEVKDCVIDKERNRVIFVVKEGFMGLAIGRRGTNIRRIKRLIGKDVEVVEYAEDPREFLKKILTPARVRAIRIIEKEEGEKMAVIEVEPEDKGIAIGRGGKNIQKARILMKRHFNVDRVLIV